MSGNHNTALGGGLAPQCRLNRSGFTLLEVMIALIVLALSIGAVTSAMITTKTMSRVQIERDLALDAAESVVESIRASTPSEVFARFNQAAGDDLPGQLTNNTFAVPGLTPLAADPDGIVGEVLFPGNGIEIREDFVDPALGMPRDLNGDGVDPPDALDHALDYTILPVRVRTEWFGAGGPQQLDLIFVTSNR